MKPNQPLTVESPTIPSQLVRALVACLQEFDSDELPSIPDRAKRLAFANAVYLCAHEPADADALKREFRPLGLSEDGIFQLDAALTAFRFEGSWVDDLGDTLDRIWHASRAASEDTLDRIIFSFRAGLHAGEKHPDFVKGMVDTSSRLNSESRYLVSRLLTWRRTNWEPVEPPFVEYMASFYTAGSVLQRVMVGSSKDVLAIVRSLSNPWDLRIWSETGWSGGRRGVKHYPEQVRRMISELEKGELATFTGLYRSCVIGTASADGAIRPDRATLKFFSLRFGRDYAGIYCRGDQPRLIAHAAFDFCFWMGIISTQPVPTEGKPD
jgi:hypothetical protein